MWYVTPLVEVSGVGRLDLELWSNVIQMPTRRHRKSLTQPFIFVLGFLAGVFCVCLVAYALFG